MIAQGSDIGSNFGGVGREAVFPNILAKFGGKKRELVKCVVFTAAETAFFVHASFDVAWASASAMMSEKLVAAS